MVEIYKKHLRKSGKNDRIYTIGKGSIYHKTCTRANSVNKIKLFVGERGHV